MLQIQLLVVGLKAKAKSIIIIIIIIIIILPSVSIPEGGLKIRKNYKMLGMSSNPCSHDLANCHTKEPR